MNSNIETINFFEKNFSEKLREYGYSLKKVELIEEEEQLSLLYEHDTYDVKIFVCSDYIFPELKDNNNAELTAWRTKRPEDKCSCHKCKHHNGQLILSFHDGPKKDREDRATV